MALMIRVQSVHNGVPGTPYLSTFYFRSIPGLASQDLVNAVQDFWNALRNGMATPWTVSTVSEVALMEDTTGDIGTTQAVVNTTITAGGSGLDWTAKQGNLALRTGNYRDGRRIQGRIYLPAVTSASGEQEANDPYINRANGAGNDLIGAVSDLGSAWVVWSRPKNEAMNDGRIANIGQVNCRREWAVLRSRRD